MVEVAANDPVFSQEEDNLSDTERFELDDFTLISSELAQEVDDGPAEKVDSTDTLPSRPLKKDGKKKKTKNKHKKAVSEPGDVVPHDDTTHTEASVEVPEKQKKSERKRLKRTRSDSEEEYGEEEIGTSKKRKDKSAHDEDSDDKIERRKRRADKKREELDTLASIRKAKEKKEKDKTNEKGRDKLKDKDREKEKEREQRQEATESEESDSEPEDTEVVPVSTFLSEFRPSGALVDDTPTPKRRSKFGESILSRRPASPLIVPFERPRIKPTVPSLQPQETKPPQLSQLPTEPNGTGYQSNLHSQVQTQTQSQSQLQSQSQYSYPTDGFPHQQWDLMEQQQLELQQQQMQQQQQQQQQQLLLLQQQQQQQQHSLNQSEPEPSLHKSHKHKKHTKDKEKREKEKREKEKREKAKREKKHKKDKPQRLDPATPEYAAKRKEFKLKLSATVGSRLKKYFRANRIATKDDFKHLARKFTHKIMALEDAKAVFVIKSNTEEKIHKVIDAYFERHNTYNRSSAPLTADDQPDHVVDSV